MQKNITHMLNANLKQFFHTTGRLYIVTLLFVTLAAALFWLDFFRAYRAEMEILVIGKTDATATDQVVENFAELSRNLSFYEKVIAGNELLDDEFAGLSKDKRKEKWNEIFQAARSEKSGVLTLSVEKKRSEDAKLMVEAVAKELFTTGSFYYNVKTDIDMRVIDGPIVATALSRPFLYAGVSLGSGILVTSLFFWLLQATPSVLGTRGKRNVAISFGTSGEKAYPDFHIGDSVPLIDPKKFIPSRPASLSFDTPSAEEKEEERKIREEILATHHKASAPANLPVAPDERDLPIALEDLPFQFEETVPEKEEKADEEKAEEQPAPAPLFESSKEEKLPEPTVEEYKRRLNELLKGSK